MKLNEHVGATVRERRRLLGITLEQLSSAIGITYQQLQKYENGSNRIDAVRLAMLSTALDLPLQGFFPQTGQQAVPAPRLLDRLEPADQIARDETMILIRAFTRVNKTATREALLQLIQAIADAEDRQTSPRSGA